MQDMLIFTCDSYGVE